MSVTIILSRRQVVLRSGPHFVGLRTSRFREAWEGKRVPLPFGCRAFYRRDY
jgi:hypothetical protein